MGKRRMLLLGSLVIAVAAIGIVLGSACDDPPDCQEAIEASCDASNSSVDWFTYWGKRGVCEGGCEDTRTVAVVCAVAP